MRPLITVLCLFYGCVVMFLGLEVLFFALDRRVEDRGLPGDLDFELVSSSAPDRPAPSRPAIDRGLGSSPSAPTMRVVVPEPELLPIPGGFEWTGNVVVIDAEGVEHREESGSFALEWGTWPKLANREVRVERGAFRESVPSGTELSLGAFRLGGRAAQCETPRVTPDSTGRLDLLVHWGRPLELAVVDQATRAPLGGVELAAGLRGASSRELVQTEIDPARLIIRGAASPVRLTDELSGSATLWVRAPGYAWGRIDIDLFAGGRREIGLYPAGDLVVEVVDLPANTGAVLRLVGGPAAEANSPVLTRDLRSDSTLHLGQLPAGTYEARVEWGENAENSDLWGAESVRVAAGTTTRVRIVLDSREETEPASPVSGILELPSAYRAAKPSLVISFLQGGVPARAKQVRMPIGSMEQLEPESFAWHAGNLAPGHYLLEVVPLSTRRVLEVRPGGERNVLVQVEPPGELVIVPYDGATGERIADAIVTWHAAPPEGVTNWTPERALADPRSRQVEIIAPAGELRLSIQAPGYAMATTSARVEPGRKGLSVPLERRCELVVSIQDGQALIPYASGFHVDAAQIGGDGRAVAWHAADSRCRVELSQPGAYRVQLKVPPAFETPPAQEIAIERGAQTALTFQLRRR